MKTEQEVKNMIKEIEGYCAEVLTGSIATVNINAPRALMQISAESRLQILYWILGKKFKSKLKGVNC